MKNPFALKIVFAALCLVMLGLQLRSMSGWTEDRAVYDDICYLRQAHLFQRFGLAGFDTDISRDDDSYLKPKLKAIGFPGWNDQKQLPCHNFFPATGKLVIQYPPGPGMVLALFPEGRQVVPMFMLATIAVFCVALLGDFSGANARFDRHRRIVRRLRHLHHDQSDQGQLFDGADRGRVRAVGISRRAMADVITAGFANALLVALGLLLGFAVDLRLANLFLASGYCFSFSSPFSARATAAISARRGVRRRTARRDDPSSFPRRSTPEVRSSRPIAAHRTSSRSISR